jgi:hypothetical protein
MNKIKVRYGIGNETIELVPIGTTVGQILSNPNIKTKLGFGENVHGVVDGVAQGACSVLADGDEINVETTVGTKQG